MLRGAFTLVELLVVLAIIGILAALSLGSLSKLGASPDRSKAISNMRQIGTGITFFAADNDGKLPGPLWPGQLAQFDPARSGRLVRELAPYLGIPTPTAPKVEALFVPPAYRKAVSASFLDSARTYVEPVRKVLFFAVCDFSRAPPIFSHQLDKNMFFL